MTAITVPPAARTVLALLRGAGERAYVVGGCVRDSLLGVEPKDWDICTSARPERVEALLGARGVPTVETGLRHGTVTAVVEGAPYEITTFRVDGPYSDHRRPDSVRFVPSLREDLARRDFTVNAMAYCEEEGLVDCFGGREDLAAKIIRCVGDPERRFGEDALRILRALRFAAVYGFTVEEETAAAVRRGAGRLDRIAAERIRAELGKLLTGAGASEVLLAFPEVVTAILPELGPSVGFIQRSPWHVFPVYEHMARAVGYARGGEAVKLALLLHDAGKPACRRLGEDGHYHGHPAVSRDLAEAALTRLRYDNRTKEAVLTLIALHDARVEPTDRSVRRWLQRLGEERLRELLEVQRADMLAQNPEKTGEGLRQLHEATAILDALVAARSCYSLKTLAVGGDDLLALGYREGRAVGQTLRTLLDAVVSGALPNERESLLREAARLLAGEK